MTYNKAVKPHIDSKLTDYSDAMSNNNERQAFAALEDAHLELWKVSSIPQLQQL